MPKAPYAVGARANHGVCCGVEGTKCGAGATPDADEESHDRGRGNEPGGDAAVERGGRAQRARQTRAVFVSGRSRARSRSKRIASDESAVVAQCTTAGRNGERVCRHAGGRARYHPRVIRSQRSTDTPPPRDRSCDPSPGDVATEVLDATERDPLPRVDVRAETSNRRASRRRASPPSSLAHRMLNRRRDPRCRRPSGCT